MDYLVGLLLIDIGVAIGLLLAAFMISAGGCYEGCKLKRKKK